jgi:histone H1/5
MNAALPKKLASYIHDTGTRALDHLAENVPPPAEGAAPDALQILLASWRSMTTPQKDDFVDRVSASVGEVIAASATLPVGVKTGTKAMKSARKVLKKSARTLKKNAKAVAKKVKAIAKTAKAPKKPAPKKKRAPKKRAAKRATTSGSTAA